MIVESYQITADNTDLLAAPSRLAAIPYDGQLVLEFQADVNDASNYWEVTIQLPDGSTPLNNVRIPEGANAGSVNLNDKYSLAFPVAQGGHVTVDCDETGTAVLDVRATLMP